MKTKATLKTVLSAAMAVVMLYGCSKSSQVRPTSSEDGASLPTTHDGLHVYGLTATSEAEYSALPKFSLDAFQSQFGVNALKASSPVVTLANPAVRDQGQLGSCTSFCGTTAYEIMYNYKTGAFPAILAPAFLYYQERVHEEGEKISADEGANMVNIDQALTTYGVCTETLMPYPTSDKSTAYKTPPTTAAISNALSYKISSYTLINTGDTAAVKTCLRASIPVMFGFNVYDNTKYTIFEGLTGAASTYSPLTASGALVSGAKLLGGHANVIIGYDDTKKAFKVQNSWGTSWGNAGFYYLPYSVFSSTKIVPQGGVYYAVI